MTIAFELCLMVVSLTCWNCSGVLIFGAVGAEKPPLSVLRMAADIGTAVVLLFGEGARGRGLLCRRSGQGGSLGEGMISRSTETLKDVGWEQAMKEAYAVSLLQKRLLQMTAGWVAGSTICSPSFWPHHLLGRNGAFLGLGFSSLSKGVWGPPVFLWFLFQQGEIYGITWQSLQAGPDTATNRSSGSFFSSASFYRSGVLLEVIFSSPVTFSAPLIPRLRKRADRSRYLRPGAVKTASHLLKHDAGGEGDQSSRKEGSKGQTEGGNDVSLGSRFGQWPFFRGRPIHDTSRFYGRLCLQRGDSSNHNL